MVSFRRSKNKKAIDKSNDKSSTDMGSKERTGRMEKYRRISFSVRSASTLGMDVRGDDEQSTALEAREDTERDSSHINNSDNTNGKSDANRSPSFSFSSSFQDQQVFVLGYMSKTRKMLDNFSLDNVSVAALHSLDPYGLMTGDSNPCQAISDVPKEIKTYYDAFSDSYGIDFQTPGIMGSSSESSPPISSRSLLESVSREGTTGETRTVTFGYCHVREYNRTVGDHPDVSDDGPPLTITWDYIQLPNVPLDYYEAKKKRRRRRRLERRNRRSGFAQHIPNIEMTVPRIKGPARRELLWSEFDVPAEELAEAEESVRRIAELREESCSQSILSEKTEELLQSAQRRLRPLLRRSFGFAKNAKDRSSSNLSSIICSSKKNRGGIGKDSDGFATSLYREALRRQTESEGSAGRSKAAAAGPEPDGLGGWRTSDSQPPSLLGGGSL